MNICYKLFAFNSITVYYYTNNGIPYGIFTHEYNVLRSYSHACPSVHSCSTSLLLLVLPKEFLFYFSPFFNSRFYIWVNTMIIFLNLVGFAKYYNYQFHLKKQFHSSSWLNKAQLCTWSTVSLFIRCSWHFGWFHFSIIVYSVIVSMDVQVSLLYVGVVQLGLMVPSPHTDVLSGCACSCPSLQIPLVLLINGHLFQQGIVFLMIAILTAWDGILLYNLDTV